MVRRCALVSGMMVTLFAVALELAAATLLKKHSKKAIGSTDNINSDDTGQDQEGGTKAISAEQEDEYNDEFEMQPSSHCTDVFLFYSRAATNICFLQPLKDVRLMRGWRV